jgi:hypothetical protein
VIAKKVRIGKINHQLTTLIRFYVRNGIALLAILIRSKETNMKKIFIGFMTLAWAIMLFKTVQVAAAQSDSFLQLYWSEMLLSSWQAHFNVDLLVHSMLFACWILYRESKLSVSIPCGVAAIYFGAVFSFLYFIVAIFRSKGDVLVVVNGSSR